MLQVSFIFITLKLDMPVIFIWCGNDETHILPFNNLKNILLIYLNTTGFFSKYVLYNAFKNIYRRGMKFPTMSKGPYSIRSFSNGEQKAAISVRCLVQSLNQQQKLQIHQELRPSSDADFRNSSSIILKGGQLWGLITFRCKMVQQHDHQSFWFSFVVQFLINYLRYSTLHDEVGFVLLCSIVG